MTDSPVELRAGDLRVALRADLGGCIAGFWRLGVPVLRSTEPTLLTSSRASACFPLAPYANRLGYRRFRWLGREHTTAANVDDSPHSLHGVAWLRPWQVVAADGVAAELAYRHAPDAHWPFAFEARQWVSLEPGALQLRLALTNLEPNPQPVGLGWHPSFPRRPRSRLHAEVGERWDTDATGLPTRRVPQPGIDGDVVHLAFDHCFEGWRGAARIRDEKHSLRLTSSLTSLVVYTPQTEERFCVEPVSHVANAIHMADPQAHGLLALPAGERCDAWMRIEAAAI